MLESVDVTEAESDHERLHPDVCGAALALLAAGWLGAFAFMPIWMRLAGVVVLVAAAGWAARMRLRLAFPSALMCALALGGTTIPLCMRLWPAPLFIALVVTAIAARVVRNADAFRWLRRGLLSWRVVAAMVLTIVVSSAALLLWIAILRPPLVDNVRLPPAPLWLIAAGAVGWSMLNAVGEECVFRGMLLDALRMSMSSTMAVVVQAMAFGLIHFRGFPSGWIGVALAAAYGLMLGALRLRAGGMLAPVLTHVFADMTIMGIIFLPVLRPP